MVRARKRPATPPPPDDGLDVNAVVSYNVRAIRERRRMTQQGVADRLAQLTGHQLPQASISAMEASSRVLPDRRSPSSILLNRRMNLATAPRRASSAST